MAQQVYAVAQKELDKKRADLKQADVFVSWLKDLGKKHFRFISVTRDAASMWVAVGGAALIS